jgi:hypothetical protein
MVAAVAIWALFGGAAFVGATHTEPSALTLVEADKECQAEGFDFGWKIDEIDDLHPGPYTFSNEDGTVTGSITFTGDDPDGQPTGYTDLVVAPPYDGIIVKQPQEGGGISHITFCYNIPEETATPTPTPTPVVTPTPTPVVTPTPTPVVTPTPTPVVTPTPTPTGTEVVATPTPTPVVTPTPTPVVTPTPTPVVTPTPTPSETAGPATPTPSETVAGATPTPVITPPATSTETPASTPTQSGLLLVLLLLGMGTTGLLVFSPKRLRSR